MRNRGAAESAIQTEIDRIAYFATDHDGNQDPGAYDESFSYNLGEEIKRLLRQDLGLKGVLSLSENWNEPLMWSHYAAQHQGICIEYQTTGFEVKRLKAVNYNASRSIRAHDLYLWKCRGDDRAESRVFETYFYAKAPQWTYEKEWRDISDTAGSNASHFDLTAIHFGMRTDYVWKWILAKALHLDKHIALYNVFADEKSFKLNRQEMDRDEIERRGIDKPAFRVFAEFLNVEAADVAVGQELLRALAVGSGDVTQR
jgi:Protein of unknown function (DUF2971).